MPFVLKHIATLDFAQQKENPTGRTTQHNPASSSVAQGDCVGCGNPADDDEMIRIGFGIKLYSLALMSYISC
jgi:hypothetical protein